MEIDFRCAMAIKAVATEGEWGQDKKIRESFCSPLTYATEFVLEDTPPVSLRLSLKLFYYPSLEVCLFATHMGVCCLLHKTGSKLLINEHISETNSLKHGKLASY